MHGFPMVKAYSVLYAHSLNGNGPGFRAPLNQITRISDGSEDDRLIARPDPALTYAFVPFDLRREPLVVTLPRRYDHQYHSWQLVDLNTHNFAYLGTRTTGNRGGRFLLAGPNWIGRSPGGFRAVIRSDTELAFAIVRTQRLGPSSRSVWRAQPAGRVEPLSHYLGGASPPPAAAPVWPAPRKTDDVVMFELMNFLLLFAPPRPVDIEPMRRFARIGIGPGLPFDPEALSPDMKGALDAGIANAQAESEAFRAMIDRQGRDFVQSSSDRPRRNCFYRYTAARIGSFGSSREELVRVDYRFDEAGRSLDGSQSRYSMHFSVGQLPPAGSFWSLTVYDAAQRPAESRSVTGASEKGNAGVAQGLTIHLQARSPLRKQSADWIAVPAGPFSVSLVLYVPKPEALDGTWQPPSIRHDHDSARGNDSDVGTDKIGSDQERLTGVSERQ